LAEGILKKKIEENNLDWVVDSAGTGSWHIGEHPDHRSMAIANKYGVDISAQRARQFKPADLDRFDLVLAMDSSNYSNILQSAISAGQKEKVHLILDFLHPGANENVPDPYWDDNGFDRVFHMLNEACQKVVERYGAVVSG